MQLVLRQVRPELDAAGPLDVVVPVGGQQRDRLAGVEQVLDVRQGAVRYGERDGAGLGEVDQLVAQAEVEQVVLPALHPRRDRAAAGVDAGLVGGRRGAGDEVLPGVRLGAVLDDLDDAVRAVVGGRQRQDPALPAGVDVDDALRPGTCRRRGR